jgi:acetylornithine deacetylase/succinyl-diaminopimelate desuccinylase-like protein
LHSDIDAHWQAIADRAVEDLATLLRFDTTNPPGNEGPAIEWLASRLRDHGIEPTILSSSGRPNLVARIRGDGTGGGPLLLAGHVDVVPVERENWTHDPFGGEVHDGYLYGRGAVDMKHMVVHCLTAFLLIKRSGITPRRDVIFAAVSDEEEGCTHGSRFLVEQHPELVRAEYMLGEFGGFSHDVNGVRYYMLQAAERGVCQFRLTAHGEPGHGSVPHHQNAVVRLGEALAKLGTRRLPPHICETVRISNAEMAAHQKPPARWILPRVLNPALTHFVLDRVLPDRGLANSLAAQLGNTVSPTMLEAGVKANVIPGTATAVLDGRLVPGQTAADLLREVHDLIGPGFDTEVIRTFEGREEPVRDPLFELMRETILRHDPEGVPVPYLLPGFTDGQYFGRLGARCYGFAPVRFPKADGVVFAKLVHGHDERIHVEGYRWGLRCFWDLVARFVGVGEAPPR